MVSKIIKSRTEIRDKIANALRLITEPVVQTLSPKGRNVMYEDGGISQTNDGVTIAKQISSDDPFEQAIIEVVRQGALSTNRDAGDGTTTTTMLTNIMTNGGLKIVDDGVNPMVLSKELTAFGEKLIANLNPIEIKDDEQLHNIARISSNNDEEIAKDVLDIVKTAGEDGMVFIEAHNKENTVVEKDTGFIVDGGLFSPEYAQNQGMIAQFEDCAVLICDKRIYYEEEAETILRVAIEAGINQLVIVARDFIGKSINVFSANHQKNPAVKLILIKDVNANETSPQSLTDLSVYLGGTLITERTGKLVNNLKPEDFSRAKKVYANPQRAVISTNIVDNPDLDKRIKALKDEKDKDDSDKEVNRRLSALTNGMVTVKVGGQTLIQVQEKIFRYEDAINATRSAMKHGYLPGGGLALLNAFKPEEHPVELVPLFRKYCEAPIRQIAKNCGEHEESVIQGCIPMIGVGYNARTGVHEDLLQAGVIDPYKVLELAIRNSISVANVILTTEYYIVVNKDKDKDKK